MKAIDFILGMLDHLTFLKDGLKLLFLYALFRNDFGVL